MSDFVAQIQAILDTSKAEAQLKALQKNQKIKLDVELSNDGVNLNKFLEKQMSSLNATAKKTGQNVAKNLNQGIKSVEFDREDFLKKYQENYFKKYKDAIEQAKKLEKDYKVPNRIAFSGAKASQSAAEKEQKALNKIYEEQQKKIVEFSKKFELGEYKAQRNSILNKLEKYSNSNSQELKSAKQYADEYEKIYSKISKHFNKTSELSENDLISEFDKLSDAAKKFNNEIKLVGKPFSTLDATIASNKTLTWLNNNTKAAKEFGEALTELAAKQKSATSSEELADYNKQFKAIVSTAQEKGAVGNSFFNEAKRAFGQIFQFSQIYGGIDKAINSVENAVSKLKEMDSILTEISKVSDMSSNQLKELGNNAFDYANLYGKKVTDYLEGVTEMNRSGFYGQKGVDLANTSVLAQAAGDMSANVANAYLLATNAAYEYAGSAEKLNAVLDGQNMITNRNSVNMTDMAEATTQAGSMAAQAGVQVDQLSALIGTAVARTKKTGNEIGTALKALFINLQNTQNDKIVDTFDSVGISMTKMVDGSEMLKTPIELLKELSTVYNTLHDGSVLKADILTNIGGKHHANVLSSILAGYSDYEKMLIDYSEGTGSAAIEAEKSANNWEGSLNKLSNSWTKFISNFANSDQITSGISTVNKLVDGADKLVNTLTPLGTIGAGIGIFEFFKNLDLFYKLV